MLKIEMTENQYQERYLKPLKQVESGIVEILHNNDTESLKKLTDNIRQIKERLDRWNKD